MYNKQQTAFMFEKSIVVESQQQRLLFIPVRWMTLKVIGDMVGLEVKQHNKQTETTINNRLLHQQEILHGIQLDKSQILRWNAWTSWIY